MSAFQTPGRAPTALALFATLLVAACSGSDGSEVGFVSSGELASVAGIVADDFHSGALDTSLWEVVDPIGDGTVDLVGAGTPDAHLLLSVPAGTQHDAWTTNTALRVMQPAANEDFEIEVKFESEPTQRYQSQGLLVEQEPGNYVRFDVYTDGRFLRVFSATFEDGQRDIHVNDKIAEGPMTFLRLARSGDTWTARYSYDGSSWLTAASFSHALSVSSVGVFAGNFRPNPGFTAVVDYFQETSAPIASEDPPLCDPTVPLVLTTDATDGSILREPDLSSYACGDVVTLTAQPDPGATFIGWSGAMSGTQNPSQLTMTADASVTATFDLDTAPPQVSNVSVAPSGTSAVVSWQTDELSSGVVEYGLTTSYELGSVASSTLSTAHAATLTDLTEGQTYQYRITADDSFGNSVTGADSTFTTLDTSCVLTTIATNGTILRNPDLSVYTCGDVVTLTAQPDVGATFLGWGGALGGTTNPVNFTVDTDATVTATFDLDTTPPQVSNVNATAGETSVTISWATDELSTGIVDYGLTTSYELGSVPSSTSSTTHSVTLSGLVAGQTYHYRITASDGFGNSASTVDATVTTTGSGGGTGGSGGGPGPSAFLSDDFFDGALDPVLWDVVDPQADGTVEVVGAGTSDAQLLLSVPAGTPHDAWTTNTALRVMQPATDEDFEIEVKFESEPTQKYQSQGVLAEQDPSNYVRFDVYSDGNSLRAFSATFSNGSRSIKVNDTIPAGPTTYLRLTRSGDQWTAQYSHDGASWTTAASFTHALAVTAVGPFAGNFSPNPAYTAVVDYFFETGSPIDPEDGPACAAGEEFSVAVSSTGPGTVDQDPDLSTYACGEVVTLTAQPDPGATFSGWSGSLSGTSNPASLTVNADANITADFALDTAPPQISNVSATAAGSSATVSWQTNEPSTGFVEYGLTTSYELGSVPSSTSSTSHSVTLTSLSEDQLYHYRVTAEDALGNSATTADATFFTNAGGGPVIDVWYGDSQSFGTIGSNPQRWINVLGQVSDPDGVASLSYSLNGGPSQGLSMGPDRRLEESGDFNVELEHIELSSGTNVISIRAVDGLGFERVKVVSLDYTTGVVWPLDYSVDWSSASSIGDVAQIVDGRWSIVGGALRNDQYGYDRIVAIGDISWTDYEVTVPVMVHSMSSEGFQNPNGSPGVGVMLKWPGHSDWTGSEQPNMGYYPGGGGGWLKFDASGVGTLRIDDFQPGGVFGIDTLLRDFQIGTSYIWKVRVETQPDGTALYRMKVWVEGTAEPSSWELSGIDDIDTPGGCLILIAHYTDVSFGNVTISPL